MASLDARRRNRCARINPKSGTACPAKPAHDASFCVLHLCPQCWGEKSGHDGLCDECRTRSTHSKRRENNNAPTREKYHYRRRTQRSGPNYDDVQAKLEKLEQVKLANDTTAEQREREYQELRLRLMEEERLLAKQLRELEFASDEGVRELELLQHRREILLAEAEELEADRSEEEREENEESHRLLDWVTEVRGEYEAIAQVVRTKLHRQSSRVKAERKRFEVDQQAFEHETLRERTEREARDATRHRRFTELESRQNMLQAEWEEVERRKRQLASVDEPDAAPFPPAGMYQRSEEKYNRRPQGGVPRHRTHGVEVDDLFESPSTWDSRRL
eukprot:TRINITY_DN60_c0_g3_i1.p1 TRINITY_DN60_c0_g3~~TRINITY_DN60_c0_g3_i1.p1  ORF type:complete len:339 (+),score=54.04 TRINITY_DN60_c0_g3_i1:24-1019(+)